MMAMPVAPETMRLRRSRSLTTSAAFWRDRATAIANGRQTSAQPSRNAIWGPIASSGERCLSTSRASNGPRSNWMSVLASVATTTSCQRASRMGARRAPQAISGSTKKTSAGGLDRDERPEGDHHGEGPADPRLGPAALARVAELLHEQGQQDQLGGQVGAERHHQDFPGHAEVGDGGREGEQDGARGRADHGSEGEAREVQVVVEATAVAPPDGEHLHRDETLDDDGDGVRRRRPRAGSRPGRRWRRRAPRRRRRGRARPAVRRTPARRRPDPPATSHRCGCRPMRRAPLPVRALPRAASGPRRAHAA